jgi:sugar/nucleoside kinase (ribokinase family)
MQFPFDLRRNTEFDVIGFGTNAVDFLIRVPEYPAFASKIELTDYVRAAGGEVATTMAGLQRLGLKTSYAGRFGDDDAGMFGLESLRLEGVGLSFAEQIPGASTQIAFIVIDTRNGERTVIWQRDSRLAYSEADAPLSAADSASILHMTPHDTQACIAMAKTARRSGTIVSLDVDNVFDGISDLLPLVDVLIVSSEFPGKLIDIDEPRKALKELQGRFGSSVVGVTLGDQGSLLLCGDSFVDTSGFAVPGGCKDTTGAGDSYRVGLLYGLLNGSSVEESSRMANAVAALKCRSVGARTSLPTPNELEELLATGHSVAQG